MKSQHFQQLYVNFQLLWNHMEQKHSISHKEAYLYVQAKSKLLNDVP